MPYSRRHAAILAIAATIGIAVLPVAARTLQSHLDPFDDKPFTSTAWREARPEDRAPMARDIVRHLPAGVTSDHVIELLGEPTPVTRYGQADAFGNALKYPETWSYYLGSWSLYSGLDSAFLYVHFDSSKRVAFVEITGG